MSVQIAWKPQIALGHRLQWEDAQSAWVLLYPEGMVKLNQSAGEILRRCDGNREIPAIVHELEEAFEVSGIEGQVQDMLVEGARRGWLY
ncbi:MAG: coenzyme biosynthesis protein PqqD [Pseudomonadota bacterium]